MLPKKKPKKGAPSWMVSFADLQQLLLVFFILLFSMSSVEESKFNSAVASIQRALNNAGLGLSDSGFKPQGMLDLDSVDEDYTEVANLTDKKLSEIKVFLENNLLNGEPLTNYVSATSTMEGVTLTIKDIALFESGSADIKPESSDILKKLTPIINNQDQKIRVEGHTDNVPIYNGEKYKDNWELSTARASNVVNFLINENILPPQNISAAGYSEFKPIAPNDTSENRSKNRRVDIILLNNINKQK